MLSAHNGFSKHTEISRARARSGAILALSNWATYPLFMGIFAYPLMHNLIHNPTESVYSSNTEMSRP